MFTGKTSMMQKVIKTDRKLICKNIRPFQRSGVGQRSSRFVVQRHEHVSLGDTGLYLFNVEYDSERDAGGYLIVMPARDYERFKPDLYTTNASTSTWQKMLSFTRLRHYEVEDIDAVLQWN